MMTTAQAKALTVLMAHATKWTTADASTFSVSTGDALVRDGLATKRAFPRTARGFHSTYRITGKGIIKARRA